MRRSRFLTLRSTVSAAFALMALTAIPGAGATDRPNLIYILLDDAGYGDLSCYGQSRFETPHIDRLASEGMKFLQHYAGSTVCAPTRCVLMTGVHTGHSYIRGNREVQPEGQAPMPGGMVTLPRLLKEAGYVTGAFGKWGLGAPGSASDPSRHFDRFYGYNCQRQAHTFYPSHLWRDTEIIKLDGETYSHDLILSEALQFIRNHRNDPFFAFLPVTIPHAALHVPAEEAAPFREKFPEFEDTIGKYRGPEVRNPIAAFAGMMTRLDRGVGQLLALLEELAIDDNTLVMLSSDNGPHREGGHDPVFFDSNGPFRGFKRDLTEGGIRVPCLARWPGKIPGGNVSDHISAQWDILPTFCELAGMAVPEGIDGISMVSTLLGQSGRQKPHDSLYWEFYEGGGKRAIRFGNWKAVQLNVGKNGFDGPLELYNLETDPGEARDVAAAHPSIVGQARQKMAAAHTPSPLWEFAPAVKKKKGTAPSTTKP